MSTLPELKEMKKAVPERDRVRGSLVGGAIGDALGYAVEFDSYSAITHHYGPEGIRRYDMNRNWGGYDGSEGKALISDDTQMTLFTACGILNAERQVSRLFIAYARPIWSGITLRQVSLRKCRRTVGSRHYQK